MSSSAAVVKMIITFVTIWGIYPILSTKDLLKHVWQKLISHKLLAFRVTDDVATHNVMHTSKASAEKPALFLITDNYCICTPRRLEE